MRPLNYPMLRNDPFVSNYHGHQQVAEQAMFH